MKKAGLILLIFSTAVSGSAQLPDHLAVKGFVTGLPDKSKVKLTSVFSGNVLDSAYLKNDQFVLSGGSVKEAAPLNVVISAGGNFHSVMIFAGNDDLSIKGDISNFPDQLVVKGSSNNDLMTSLKQSTADLTARRKTKLNEYLTIRRAGKITDSTKNAFWGNTGSIKMIDEEILSIQKSFIRTNINSYYALYLLSVIKANYRKKELIDLLGKVSEQYKTSNYVNAVFVYLKSKELTTGDHYTDFTALDAANNSVHFSDYFKGKYVLLDFSTPYCQFCVQAIKPLKTLSEKNKSNLEIVTFYVDEEKNGYTSLQDKSKKPWSVIWDGKGRLGDAYNLFNIYSTPSFYLFDPEGNLVSKTDGFDEDYIVSISGMLK